MNEVENLYNKNYNHLLGNKVSWLKEIRHSLLKEINKNGFPTKKDEIWKYSDLQKINQIKYKFNNHDAKLYNVNNENTINLINGKYFVSNNLKNSNKMNLKSLNDSIEHFKNYFYFNKNYFNKDFIIDLNTIFLSDGLSISINEDQIVKILINYDNNLDDITNYVRNIIKVSKNAKLVIMEDFRKTNSKNNFYNIFNNFWLEEGAEVEHIIFQDCHESSNIFYSSLNYCYKDTNFNQLSFQIGSGSSKFQHYSNLIDTDSSVNHHGIYFGKNNQFMDNKTSVVHHKQNCQSNQIYKGVLTNESIANYLSNTLVKPEAQLTNAYQLSRGILLSDKCKINTKPELKIYADDVKCSHGSTVGDIDKDQIYYLQSRGLTKAQSKNLIIKAFYQDILNIFNDEDNLINNKINNAVDNWLIEND